MGFDLPVDKPVPSFCLLRVKLFVTCIMFKRFSQNLFGRKPYRFLHMAGNVHVISSACFVWAQLLQQQSSTAWGEFAVKYDKRWF